MIGYRNKLNQVHKRALVIDDDMELCELVGIVLKIQGYEVALAFGGQEGLRLFGEMQPDVVVLDLMMPEVDGWSVLEQIRQASTVPVVILTGAWVVGVEGKGYARGANDLMRKPFAPSELVAHIAQVMN